MDEKKRYFIVFYTGWSASNSHYFGKIDMTCNDYLNEQATEKEIIRNEPVLERVVITNFIEVNEKDWQVWRQKS